MTDIIFISPGIIYILSSQLTAVWQRDNFLPILLQFIEIVKNSLQ